MSADNETDHPRSTTRRHVLRLLAAGVAGGTLVPSLVAASGTRSLFNDVLTRRMGRIGLQLYTVRTALAKDIEGTIAAIAAAGITELEFAGYYAKDPAWWTAMLKTHNLTAPSAHMALPKTDAEWGPMFDTANAMGHKLVIMPYLTPDQRKTSDDWRKVAARLNTAATMAKAAGLQFGYHNHDFEFAPIDGTTGYDIITSQTDTSLVKLEMDLYWTIRAGQDPLALIGRMPGRVVAVHVKDMGPPPERAWADVGSGSIDFKTILTKARAQGLQYWFIEHDMPKDPLASIKASAAAMKGF